MKKKSILWVAACGLLLLAGRGQAADWGDLTATFVYEGAVPSPAKISINKDPEFCGKFGLVDESLVVNPKNKGLANVIVFMSLARTDPKPPIHESYVAAKKEKVVVDNDMCRFKPHVALVQAGQTVTLGNSDTVGHNTKVDSFANPPINYTIPAGAKLDQQFSLDERLPTKVSCSIHPWMNGWLVVKEVPYMGVSDADGKLTIKNVPAGKWTFQVWQEKAGYVDDVTVGGKATKWMRGRVEVTIKAGANDLGTVGLKPDLFKE